MMTTMMYDKDDDPWEVKPGTSNMSEKDRGGGQFPPFTKQCSVEAKR